MPKKPSRQPFVCEFYNWRLFTRNGVYYADGRTKHLNLGKHSLATRDSDEAIANLRRLDRQLAVQRGLAEPSSTALESDLSIPDGWQLYLAHCERPEILGGVSPNSAKRYRAVRDKHVAFCSDRGIRLWASFATRSGEHYATWLTRQGYAERSIYLEMTLLKSVVLWLIDQTKIPAACRLDLPLKKPQGTDTYSYTQEQVSAMVQHCRINSQLGWLGDVIVALACTGFRIGELASLRWTDVDLAASMIRLTDDRASQRRQSMGTARRTKGRRNRVVPIHGALLNVLNGLARHSDGLVFHGPRGGRLKPDTVRTTLVNKVIKPLRAQFPTATGDIGFEHGRVHSFRHYFCSRAFMDGASETAVRDWLGHQDSKMVAHYRHVGDDASRKKLQGIDFIDRGGGTVLSASSKG